MAQTTLTFSKTTDIDGNPVWMAETTVNNDYNLHLERKGRGKFAISQRGTATGLYMPCRLPQELYEPGQVIDWAFGHGVYPDGGLHIRIESWKEVSSCTLSEQE